MKKAFKLLLVLVALVAALGVSFTLLTPWMDRWGATQTEISTYFPGDELVPEPTSFVNRAVTIQAAPEQVYPWLVQLGAEKGGMYSYEWLETNILRCPLVNADRIHPEWQDLQVGDEMKMCPGDFGPPAYQVVQLHPNRAIVLGHQEHGQWVDLWQLVLLPQPDGSTRLVQRTRTMMAGGLWTLIHPGVFIMERGMLLGIKERAESGLPVEFTSPTPTPEIFIPLDPSPTPSSSDLPMTCQVTDLNVFIDRQAGYCFAYPLGFTWDEATASVIGLPVGSSAEPVQATFMVETAPFDQGKSLDQQAHDFLKSFSVLDPGSFPRGSLHVGGESALLVDAVPARLSWRIVFIQHEETLYRLMYWPVDIPEVQADLEELFQTTSGSFAFLSGD
jgi:hypothetical protein